MARFDKGVSYYTRMVVPIGFPEDQVICRWCPLMRAVDGGTRHMCMATGEIIYGIDSRPDGCPAKEEKYGEAGVPQAAE